MPVRNAADMAKPRQPEGQRGWVLGVAALAVIAVWIAGHPWQNDGFTYWNAWRGGLYDLRWPEHGAWVYTPAAAQILCPLTLLPFEVFWALLVAVQALALYAVARRWTLVVVAVPWLYMPGYWNPVLGILGNGNVMILLAFVAAFGIRYPALWSFAPLTKVTPGIGLVWFVVRREWRNLGIAVGVTGAIAAVSFLLAPDLWRQWLEVMRASVGAETQGTADLYPFPLIPRVLTAALLVAWGGLTDRRWTVPVGAMLALPGLSSGGLVVGLGALYFLHDLRDGHARQDDAVVEVEGTALVVGRPEYEGVAS